MFDMWLWIELVMMVANIFGGALYIFFSKCTPVTLFLDAPERQNKGLPITDFVDKSIFMIDTTLSMFVPAFIGLTLACYTDY